MRRIVAELPVELVRISVLKMLFPWFSCRFCGGASGLGSGVVAGPHAQEFLAAQHQSRGRSDRIDACESAPLLFMHFIAMLRPLTRLFARNVLMFVNFFDPVDLRMIYD